MKISEKSWKKLSLEMNKIGDRRCFGAGISARIELKSYSTMGLSSVNSEAVCENVESLSPNTDYKIPITRHVWF